MNDTESTDTALRDEDALVALGRALAYRQLALGFAYPVEELIAPAGRDESAAGDAIVRALTAARNAARKSSLPLLQQGYMRLFDPRRPPLLFEAEYRAEHFQQRGELLSDLMGFYRAFGVMPDRERPDHLACELDFVHLLSLKEARALERGKAEEADICSTARRKFLQEHLLTWYEDVVEAVRRRAEDPRDHFYLALADALDALMKEERGFVR